MTIISLQSVYKSFEKSYTIYENILRGYWMNQSLEVAKVAIKLAISIREEEAELKKVFRSQGIKCVAVDIGANCLRSHLKCLSEL